MPTYRTIGINLKSKPTGEADRLMTILTKEQGLIRVIAPSARKQKSSLSGRSALFVVNDLLIAKGKSMDKITQAETIESYPGLALDLKKLTAGQYLVELTLQQALSEQAQTELFYLLTEHLGRLNKAVGSTILPSLAHGVFQLLALAGIAPQMHQCCLSGELLQPELGNPHWRVGFSPELGGAVTLEALDRLRAERLAFAHPHSNRPTRIASDAAQVREELVLEEFNGIRRVAEQPLQIYGRKRSRTQQLGATQVFIMQQLAGATLPILDPDWLPPGLSTEMAWLSIERLLRQCAYYQFDRAIRSASLIDSLFVSP
ncbi:MAG: DNA repair protein RecO [Synechococcales bacterium]|nr:DNA repair protein RecO [Synechococcales bacterium]